MGGESRTSFAHVGRVVILVTGAAGSIGAEVVKRLRAAGETVAASDLHVGADYLDLECDVTIANDVENAFDVFRPTHVLHLAGAKHAPAGEEDPAEVLRVNALGTAQVVEAARRYGARVLTASTCKACNPETAYGASKLIAERLRQWKSLASA